jgi:hypothetical protein
MSPAKGGAQAGSANRLGGFNSAAFKSFDKSRGGSNKVKPVAKYAGYLYKLGEELSRIGDFPGAPPKKKWRPPLAPVGATLANPDAGKLGAPLSEYSTPPNATQGELDIARNDPLPIRQLGQQFSPEFQRYQTRMREIGDPNNPEWQALSRRINNPEYKQSQTRHVWQDVQQMGQQAQHLARQEGRPIPDVSMLSPQDFNPQTRHLQRQNRHIFHLNRQVREGARKGGVPSSEIPGHGSPEAMRASTTMPTSPNSTLSLPFNEYGQYDATGQFRQYENEDLERFGGEVRESQPMASRTYVDENGQRRSVQADPLIVARERADAMLGAQKAFKEQGGVGGIHGGPSVQIPGSGYLGLGNNDNRVSPGSLANWIAPAGSQMSYQPGYAIDDPLAMTLQALGSLQQGKLTGDPRTWANAFMPDRGMAYKGPVAGRMMQYGVDPTSYGNLSQSGGAYSPGNKPIGPDGNPVGGDPRFWSYMPENMPTGMNRALMTAKSMVEGPAMNWGQFDLSSKMPGHPIHGFAKGIEKTFGGAARVAKLPGALQARYMPNPVAGGMQQLPWVGKLFSEQATGYHNPFDDAAQGLGRAQAGVADAYRRGLEGVQRGVGGVQSGINFARQQPWQATKNVANAAGRGAKNVANVTGRVASTPYRSAMQGWHGPSQFGFVSGGNLGGGAGEGAARGLKFTSGLRDVVQANFNALRGARQVAGTGQTLRGGAALADVPVQNMIARYLPKSLTGAGTRSFVGGAGRLAGAAGGIISILGEPFDEAMRLRNEKDPVKRDEIMREGSQGRWGGRYRHLPGLWNGFGGKYAQQVLMGMTSPQAATQELGASILDIPALFGGQGYGHMLSDETKDKRFGYDLTKGQALDDYYRSGTLENYKGMLERNPEGLRHWDNTVNQNADRYNQLVADAAARGEEAPAAYNKYQPTDFAGELGEEGMNNAVADERLVSMLQHGGIGDFSFNRPVGPEAYQKALTEWEAAKAKQEAPQDYQGKMPVSGTPFGEVSHRPQGLQPGDQGWVRFGKGGREMPNEEQFKPWTRSKALEFAEGMSDGDRRQLMQLAEQQMDYRAYDDPEMMRQKQWDNYLDQSIQGLAGTDRDQMLSYNDPRNTPELQQYYSSLVAGNQRAQQESATARENGDTEVARAIDIMLQGTEATEAYIQEKSPDMPADEVKARAEYMIGKSGITPPDRLKEVLYPDVEKPLSQADPTLARHFLNQRYEREGGRAEIDTMLADLPATVEALQEKYPGMSDERAIKWAALNMQNMQTKSQEGYTPHERESVVSGMQDRNLQAQEQAHEVLKHRAEYLPAKVQSMEDPLRGVTEASIAQAISQRGNKFGGGTEIDRIGQQMLDAKMKLNDPTLNLSEKDKTRYQRQLSRGAGMQTALGKLQDLRREHGTNWMGDDEVVEALRARMVGTGGAVHEYERYNPKDFKNNPQQWQEIQDTLYENRGRLDLMRALRGEKMLPVDQRYFGERNAP